MSDPNASATPLSASPRLLVDLPLAAGVRVGLPSSVAQHVGRALRLREGDPVTLFNGQGGEYSARLVSMRRDGENSVCQATVKVKVGEKFAHTVAEGDGPVNALDGALRAALTSFFPSFSTLSESAFTLALALEAG